MVLMVHMVVSLRAAGGLCSGPESDRGTFLCAIAPANVLGGRPTD